jgi:CheY-like chemotaxis protein
LEVATVLKQDPRTLNIPVLFLTSMNDPQEGDKRLGAASFLVRPAGTAALVSTIQGVLGAGVSPAGRVLVVEQDDEAREILVMMIQAHGYRVTEAAGPEEGLALAEHIPPELVLVNAVMAQERDYWLLRGLRQLGHPFDIFVLAEAFTEEQGRAAIDRGASGYSETGKLGQLLDQVRKQRDQT